MFFVAALLLHYFFSGFGALISLPSALKQKTAEPVIGLEQPIAKAAAKVRAAKAKAAAALPDNVIGEAVHRNIVDLNYAPQRRSKNTQAGRPRKERSPNRGAVMRAKRLRFGKILTLSTMRLMIQLLDPAASTQGERTDLSKTLRRIFRHIEVGNKVVRDTLDQRELSDDPGTTTEEEREDDSSYSVSSHSVEEEEDGAPFPEPVESSSEEEQEGAAPVQ